MEYRKLPHGDEQISVIGVGTSSIGMAGEKEIEETMNLALENGRSTILTWHPRMRRLSRLSEERLQDAGRTSFSRFISAPAIREENTGGRRIWIRLSVPLTGS